MRVCPKWSSKSFVIMAEIRMITALKVGCNVGSSPCMRACMSEWVSDVFMTKTSFTDVSIFIGQVSNRFKNKSR